MPFIVDACLAATWVLPDEKPAISVLRKFDFEYAIVPGLWWFEIYSLLIVAERRKRIEAADLNSALALFDELSIEVDTIVPGKDLLALARKHGLTGYDASYLELAKRHALPLATSDGALIKAAPKEGVTLLMAD